jgi:transcriptional regulator with XRE-family HTH domain
MLAAETTRLRAARPRRPARRAGLSEVAPAVAIVRYLLDEHKLTQREIARMTGADERSVRRWLASHDSIKIQRRYTSTVDDLRDLLGILGSTLPGEQFARWLRARNRYLRGARPLDVIAEGHYEQVREAGEAYADGSYV